MNGSFPGRVLLSFAIGLFGVIAALQLIPFVRSSELPSVAALPSVEDALAGLERPKPAGEFRVFTIGASLSQGFPYSPAYAASYGKLMGDGLAGFVQAPRVVTRAIARPALDSPKLVELVRRSLAWEPDLLIVTLGSNEYANRLFSSKQLLPRSLLAQVDERLGRARILWRELPGHGRRWPAPGPGDASAEKALAEKLVARALKAEPGKAQLGALPFDRDERELLLGRLRRSMQEIDALARAAKVPLVYCQAVYGLGAFWPWGHESGGQDAEIDRLALRFHLGEGEEVALEDLELEGEGRADLAFMRGLVLRRLGRREEALDEFRRARDLDPVPIHRTGPIDQVVQEEAKRLGRPLFDLNEPFCRLARDGIPGDEHFLDYGHLSASGHRIAAGYLARELAERKLLPLAADFDRAAFDRAVRASIAASISADELRYAWPRIAAANGNYGLLFGNFRDALPYLLRCFQELPMDQSNAQRLLFCLVHVAGRTGEFAQDDAEQATARSLRLYQELLQARKEQRLQDWVRSYLQAAPGKR
ncbi:MAG: hypothetical protein CSA62_09175 [Planctomycetota bacterium]|nr:MAG: hypothetical protein CSA62_09175 [Planctomycetota bacterium]